MVSKGLNSLERDEWNSDSSVPRRKRRKNQLTEKSEKIGRTSCSFLTRKELSGATHSLRDKDRSRKTVETKECI